MYKNRKKRQHDGNIQNLTFPSVSGTVQEQENRQHGGNIQNLTFSSVSGTEQEREKRMQDINIPNVFKVQRKDEDPYMFYQVKTRSDGREVALRAHQDNEEEIQINCFNFNKNKEIFSVAKAALTANLISSVWFVFTVPVQILAIIFQNCGEVTGDCENFLLLKRILIPLQVICCICHPVLILKYIVKI